MHARIIFMALLAIGITGVATALPPDTLWTRTIGGSLYDGGYSVIEANDGGYVLTGFLDGVVAFWGGEICLIKIDTSGTTLWTKRFGGIGSDRGYCVKTTMDGGYIIGGYTSSLSSGWADFCLIKTNALGELQWINSYYGFLYEYGYSVEQTWDGGYIMVGTSFDPYWVIDSNLLLLRADENGDSLWSRSYSEFSYDEGFDVQVTSDSGFIISGYTDSRMWLFKTNASGDSLWSRFFGSSGEGAEAHSVQQTVDGGLFLVGYISSTGSDYGDIWVIKTDANGDSIWSRLFDISDEDYGYSGQQTQDGGYIICGDTEPTPMNIDIIVIKIDGDGNVLWRDTYGGSNYEGGKCIRETSDGSYIIAGRTKSYGAGEDDIYLIKLASDALSTFNPVNNMTQAFKIFNCSPNPFNSTSAISYQLPALSFVRLTVYDVAGKQVATLVDEQQPAGSHQATFDGSNLPSGIYIYRLTAGENVATGKIVLLK